MPKDLSVERSKGAGKTDGGVDSMAREGHLLRILAASLLGLNQMKAKPIFCKYGSFLATVAFLLFLPGATTGLANSLVCDSTGDSPMYGLSIPTGKIAALLEGGKRITGFKVKVSGGILCSVTRIPFDWWFSIEPDMESYQVHAEAGHGASWLTMDEVNGGVFENFLVLKAFSLKGPPLLKGPLRIRVDLSIDVPAAEREEYVTINDKDMLLTPQK
jgi:hypothetical protein